MNEKLKVSDLKECIIWRIGDINKITLACVLVVTQRQFMSLLHLVAVSSRANYLSSLGSLFQLSHFLVCEI